MKTWIALTLLIVAVLFSTRSVQASGQSGTCEKNVMSWKNNQTNREQFSKAICSNGTNANVVVQCMNAVWKWSDKNQKNKLDTVQLACTGIKRAPVNYTSCLSYGYHHIFKTLGKKESRRKASAAYCNKLEFPPIAIDPANPGHLGNIVSGNEYNQCVSALDTCVDIANKFAGRSIVDDLESPYQKVRNLTFDSQSRTAEEVFARLGVDQNTRTMVFR